MFFSSSAATNFAQPVSFFLKAEHFLAHVLSRSFLSANHDVTLRFLRYMKERYFKLSIRHAMDPNRLADAS